MLLVVTSSIIAFLLTVLDSKRIITWGLKGGFILTGLLLAIHYNYGNDYMSYLEEFNKLHNYSADEIIDNNVLRNNEYGWGLINIFFSFFGEKGFFLMVAALTTFQSWIYYIIIKKYIERKWWWLAVFIYLFDTSLYLMEFSMMRQSLVMSIFLLLFGWIEKKRVIMTILVIFALSTIHSSAILLFPLAFLGYLPQRGGRFYATIIVALFIVLFVSKSVLTSIFEQFLLIESIANYSDVYSVGNYEVELGFGFIINLIPFFVAIYFLLSTRNISQKILIAVLITCLNYIVLPFALVLPMIGRISSYFLSYSILTMPVIYEHIGNTTIRDGLIALLCILTLYSYFNFFTNPVWIEHFTEFKTVFSVL